MGKLLIYYEYKKTKEYYKHKLYILFNKHFSINFFAQLNNGDYFIIHFSYFKSIQIIYTSIAFFSLLVV